MKERKGEVEEQEEAVCFIRAKLFCSLLHPQCLDQCLAYSSTQQIFIGIMRDANRH